MELSETCSKIIVLSVNDYCFRCCYLHNATDVGNYYGRLHAKYVICLFSHYHAVVRKYQYSSLSTNLRNELTSSLTQILIASSNYRSLLRKPGGVYESLDSENRAAKIMQLIVVREGTVLLPGFDDEDVDRLLHMLWYDTFLVTFILTLYLLYFLLYTELNFVSGKYMFLVRIRNAYILL